MLDTRYSTSGFSRFSFPLGPEYPVGTNFTKIRRDICNFVFIGSVNNTSNKLFTGVNNTNDIL